MQSNQLRVIVIFLTLLLICISLSGCVEEEQKSEIEDVLLLDITLDQPSILPDWNDGEYHDYYGTTDLANEFLIKYPDLVNLFSMGKSALGKDILCIKITNEQNNDHKYSCLIDGCIHGCEWESGDACLYLAEYLLINFEKNGTIKQILNTTEIFIVPLLNPDGRQIDDRFNGNGIDLNRNFDVDFGRIRGGSLPIGKIFGKRIFTYRTFPILHKWIPDFPLYILNSGRSAFSEPESKALRDIMYEIENQDFSFYVNCHTAVHNFASPWQAFKPPFKMTNQENKIFDYARKWVAENTEYENAGMSFEGQVYKSSGTASDWCFKEFRIPSFTFEILSQDYEPATGRGRHDSLVHWMKTTVPVFMYLLVNIENLHNWETPSIQPPLPEGVPPEPL
jgi:hypothetical protein